MTNAELRRDIIIQSREMFPDFTLRLQPCPNQVTEEVYQLHKRPRVSKSRADFDWTLVKSGSLPDILDYLVGPGKGYVNQ